MRLLPGTYFIGLKTRRFKFLTEIINKREIWDAEHKGKPTEHDLEHEPPAL